MRCEHLCAVTVVVKKHGLCCSHLAKISMMYAFLEFFRGRNGEENAFDLGMEVWMDG